jgi:predicted anti-sigma-YlaC factor YlaD
MKCARVRRMIWSYLDGEVGKRDASELETHLSSCEACRSEYKDAKRLVQLIGRWDGVTPKLSYEALQERIREREKRRELPLFPLPRWAEAALLLLGMVLGLNMGLQEPKAANVSWDSPRQLASLIGLSQHDDLVGAALIEGLNIAVPESGRVSQ